MPPPGFQIKKGTGDVEPTSQLVSTTRAVTTSTAHYRQTYEQKSISLPPPPRLVGDSINGARESVDSVHVGSTLGRTAKRYPCSNNSTIASVTINSKSYLGTIFDKRGNRLY